MSIPPSDLSPLAPDMSLTGRPPDPQTSAHLPDNLQGKAITTATLPLNFKSALTGRDQGSPDTTNQWLFVGEQDLIPGTFGGEPSLQISDKFREKLCIPWKKTLVIRLLGRSISYAYLCSQIRWKWRPTGHLDIMDLNNDTFLVTFSNEQDYLTALTGGPWVILDHYLVVHQWSPSFRTGQKPHRSVVAWIQLPEFPVHFYHREVLFALGNLIGRTVKLDYHTEHRQRGKFARIAVELDMSKPVPTRIYLDGFWQAVQYENLPLICFECGCVGHTEDSCSSRKSQSAMEIVVAQTGDRSSMPEDSPPEPPSGYGPWMQVTRKSRKQSGKVTPLGEQNQKNRINGHTDSRRPSSKAATKGNLHTATGGSKEGKGKETGKPEQRHGSQKGKAVKETECSKNFHQNSSKQTWRPIGPNAASSSKDGQAIIKPTSKETTNQLDSETIGPVTRILGPNNTNIQVVAVPSLRLPGKENGDPNQTASSIRHHYQKKTGGKSPTQEKKKGLNLKPSKKSVIVPSTARRELKRELNRNVKNPSFPITIQAIEALFNNNPELTSLANQQASGNSDELMEEEPAARDNSGTLVKNASQQALTPNATSAT
ncbi:unnamed protein product [Linum trigynum]|uniref:DUF4283 domain-containing protein n=1 Tax=Linum trigynum TaxID=586398 RepID=A0AAV2FI13_9ROSI